MNPGRAGDYDDGYGYERDPYQAGYGSPDDDATVNVHDYQGEYGDGSYDDGGGSYDDGGYRDGGYQDDGYGDDGYDDGGHGDHGDHGDHGGAAYDGYDDGDGEDDLPVSNRVFTIPNLISLARLAGVPLFLGLILSPYYGGPKYDVWALVILALSGFSDWLDGKLARRWNQMTKFGAMIDPLADRLYILATLVGLTIRGIIPIWLPILLVGRDVAMLVLISPKLRKAGYGVALPVHFLGKAATFNLLYAFPLLLLGQISEKPNHLTDIANIFGWAFVGWGTALYLLAGGMYFVQARQLTRGTGR
ncbi:CDP-diacylglycerol--glycerol-3-phosphate 3-phosphatidyltransferase [Catenulispora sp. MAP5-51]